MTIMQKHHVGYNKPVVELVNSSNTYYFILHSIRLNCKMCAKLLIDKNDGKFMVIKILQLRFIVWMLPRWLYHGKLCARRKVIEYALPYR